MFICRGALPLSLPPFPSGKIEYVRVCVLQITVHFALNIGPGDEPKMHQILQGCKRYLPFQNMLSHPIKEVNF